MLISYCANKKSSPRLPSWQPSLISFNAPIDSGSIIKPCTLKHFQVPILAPGLLPYYSTRASEATRWLRCKWGYADEACNDRLGRRLELATFIVCESEYDNSDIKMWRSMMMSPNGNIFRVTGHLCGELIDSRLISRTKASDAELWCSLSSASE